MRPADTNATSFESTAWYLPSYTMTRTSCNGKPAIGPAASTCSTPFSTAGMNDVGIAPPFTAFDELEAGAARQRLDAQEHLAELARAAGLLLVAMMALGRRGDRLAVRDARRLRRRPRA